LALALRDTAIEHDVVSFGFVAGVLLAIDDGIVESAIAVVIDPRLDGFTEIL
jgi:hypothetical protein